MNSKFENLQYNLKLPNKKSVLYRIKTIIYAILKYFSRKTSYIRARLAFHHYSKFIREYCNNHRFVPPLTVLISFKLILSRSHGFGSYTITLFILLKFAFTTVFTLRNSITRKSIIPKVRCHLDKLQLLISNRFQVLFHPAMQYFSTFTHVTSSLSMYYSYLSLRGWPPT